MNRLLFSSFLIFYLKFKANLCEGMMRAAQTHLKAEEAYGVDDIVLSGRS